MLYLTCTMISSVDFAHYRVSRAKDCVSVDCVTFVDINQYESQILLSTSVVSKWIPNGEYIACDQQSLGSDLSESSKLAYKGF